MNKMPTVCSTILTKLAEALQDPKTTIMGGWVGGWPRISLIIRPQAQPQAWDWAWLAWAELGKNRFLHKIPKDGPN